MDTCLCLSVGKKCLFFGKFGEVFFLVTFVLRFAFLPYYRRNGFRLFVSFESETLSSTENYVQSVIYTDYPMSLSFQIQFVRVTCTPDTRSMFRNSLINAKQICVPI